MAFFMLQLFLRAGHAGAFVVNDYDAAGIFIAEHQIGDAHKGMPGDGEFKTILHSKDFVVVAKPFKPIEVGQAGLIVFLAQPLGKWRERRDDILVIAGAIFIGQLEYSQITLGPLLQQPMAECAELCVGILNLWAFVQILKLEGLWALVIGG